jgi:transposase
MSYVQGDDRGQASLLPAAIEDYVAADAPVRVIDAFVDWLDVKGLGFGRSVPAVTGRPSYDPWDLLKLYLYGYLNEVRLVAPAGARVFSQCRGHVACAPAGA